MIDGDGHRLCTALGSDNDYLVLRLLGLQSKAAHDFLNCRFIVVSVGVNAIGQRVTARAFVETHFANVAGERGLGDVKATTDELAAQLVLAGHRRRGDDFPNYAMSFRLHLTSNIKAE